MTDWDAELENPKNAGRISLWQEMGMDAIEADLTHSNGKRYVGRHGRLAWAWVKRQKRIQSAQESVSISAGVINLTPAKLWPWAKSKISD